MRRQLLLAAVLLLTGTPPVAMAQANKQTPNKQTPKQKKQTEGKGQQAALTGCVDQQEGEYVLIQDQNRSLIAHLEADGFPTEGFAKHVGHKVTVRGTSSSTGTERPVFKVRTVDAISDTCGPQF